MKALLVIVMVACLALACKLGSWTRQDNQNGAPKTLEKTAVQSYGTRFNGSLKNLFPQKVGDSKLVVPMNPRDLGIGVPANTDVLSGVYKGSKGEIIKHVLVNFPTVPESTKT